VTSALEWFSYDIMIESIMIARYHAYSQTPAVLRFLRAITYIFGLFTVFGVLQTHNHPHAMLIILVILDGNI